MTPWLTDDELRELCAPLTQPAAIRRYLRDEFGLNCTRCKPNRMPVVSRSDVDRAISRPDSASTAPAGGAQQPNLAGLRAIMGGRR